MYTHTKRLAPLLIMTAAALWAIDSIFRTQLTFSIPPAVIVLIEHTLGFLILSPIFFKHIGDFRKLTAKTWGVFVLLVTLSSVAGGMLFTAALQQSFAFNDFVTPILLQKLEPLFVVGLSMFILKERVTLKFMLLAALALIGSYMISFGTDMVSLTLVGKEGIFLMAIGAAFCWGMGTILSKYILKQLPFAAATAMRFLIAIPVSFIFCLALGQTYNPLSLGLNEIWRFLVIAGVTGAGAIYLYYKGLQHVNANVSTFAEETFPTVAILIAISPLNPYGAPQLLSLANVFGIVIMLTAIMLISYDAGRELDPVKAKK